MAANGPAARRWTPETMTEDHPDPHLLEGFMRDHVGCDERRRIVRHLLAGCTRCLQVTRRFWRLGEIRPGGEPELTGADLHPASYRDVFNRLPSRGFTPRVFDPEREPPRIAVAFHRLALRLAKAGNGEEALAALQQAKALYELHGDVPNLLRLRYLEGKIEEALGSSQAAEAAFLEVRRGFLAEGLGIEAAAALFDLAILYRREARPAEVRRLAEELLPILRARDIRQGAAVALLFFRDLVETGRLTPEALFAVSGYLNPSMQAGRPATEAAAALIDLPR
jgi:tetratricopeptide (TPR) repeat protein